MLVFLQNLWTQNPEIFTIYIDLLKFIITSMITVIGGIWALSKWFNQISTEKKHRREDKISDLYLKFTKTTDPKTKHSYAMALSLYKDDSLPSLINFLKYESDENIQGITMALVNIGKPSFDRLLKMNKLAVKALLVERKTPEEDDDKNFVSFTKLICRSKNIIEMIFRFFKPTELSRKSLVGLDISEINLNGLFFQKTKMEYTKINNSNLSHATIENCNFVHCNLNRTNFINTNITKSHFTNNTGSVTFIASNHRKTRFLNNVFKNAEFQGAIFNDCHITSGKIIKSDFSGSKFFSIIIEDAQLSQNNWYKCELVNSKLKKTNLTLSNFYQAKLKKQINKNIRFVGSEFCGTSITNSLFENCDLSDCIFNECKIDNVVFYKCNFRLSNFDQIDFSNCTFSNCQLSLIEIKNSKFTKTKFVGKNKWEKGIITIINNDFLDVYFDVNNKGLEELFIK